MNECSQIVEESLDVVVPALFGDLGRVVLDQRPHCLWKFLRFGQAGVPDQDGQQGLVRAQTRDNLVANPVVRILEPATAVDIPRIEPARADQDEHGITSRDRVVDSVREARPRWDRVEVHEDLVGPQAVS